jgi:hypothetical protein
MTRPKKGQQPNPKKRIRSDYKGTRGTRHDPPTNAVQPGQVLNPYGAPRKGMSRAEMIRTIDGMTPEEAIECLRRMGGRGNSGLEQSLRTLPGRAGMMFLEHLSARVANICEPNPAMLAYSRDTTDGKPKERLEHSNPDGTLAMPRRIIISDRASKRE